MEELRQNWRDLFDLPEDVAYFNIASVSPLMRSVSRAIEASVARRAQPWRIANREWFDVVEERRTLLARLVGADVNGIAIVPSASYGLAVAARNLQAAPGSQVVFVADDFPSDVNTWRRFAQLRNVDFVTVERSPEQSWTAAVTTAIDERCAIVVVPNVHWTNGGLFDLVAIGARCREANARLVVDASQSLGALPFDFEAVRPDFLVSVGYKWLLGPYGLGYLYVAPEHREGIPLEENWIAREGSEDFAQLVNYVDRYRPGAQRFDVGERSALELTNGACAALRQLNEWGVETIAAALGQITRRIAERAGALGLTLSDPLHCPHMLGVELPAGSATAAAEALRAANVFVGFRGTSLRIAPHLYTTEADMERLFSAMERIAA